MNVKVTSFSNPFSFFCLPENDAKAKDLNSIANEVERSKSTFFDIEGASHGQYVAVLWQNKWARGVISLESQFVIWLIDYGINLRPSEKNVYIHLPLEYRHIPTKVFEAAIHGVLPVTKTLNEDLIVEDVPTTLWNVGSIEKAQKLIARAASVYFIPVAMLSTKHNDIVLGDLFLEFPGKGFVNIVDELKEWPVFLEENKKLYIQNLEKIYTRRRKHRANLAKPVFPGIELPSVTLECSLQEYLTICANALQFEPPYSKSKCGSTERSKKKNKGCHKLTADEIKTYSQMFIQVGEIRYNVLNVMLNKIRDLNMCELYKDYDNKSCGRACTRRSFRP